MYTQIEVNDVLKYEEIANVLRERIKSQIYPLTAFTQSSTIGRRIFSESNDHQKSH